MCGMLRRDFIVGLAGATVATPDVSRAQPAAAPQTPEWHPARDYLGSAGVVLGGTR
jgi:hypothetical protein